MKVLGLFSHILTVSVYYLPLFNHRKNIRMNTKLYAHLLIISSLIILPACDQKSNGNQKNGVKDALGGRPYEGARDAAEDAGDNVKKAGQDLKDAVNGN